MKNTGRRSKALTILLLLICFSASGQLFKKDQEDKKRDFKLLDNKRTMRKTGPFLGIERGKYTNFVLGVERQWKQLKLIQPKTQAVFFEIDYNFKYNVMGAQTGYWYKGGRLGVLYGGRLSWRTDFTYNRFGIAPFVGYKILQGEVQAGYHFLTREPLFYEVNTFFVSLKWVFVNDRKVQRN